MRRINAALTIALSALAMLLWFQGWWNGARPGGNWYSGYMSPVVYPARWATALTACACLGWILVTRSAERGDDETRCRKCRYILRGLSEPRCPECGTRI